MELEDVKGLQRIIDEQKNEIAQLKANLIHERAKAAAEKQALQDYYENILAVMPGHVYWLDEQGVYLGCNDTQARDALLLSRKEIVGKTNFDMPWSDRAEELNELYRLVMTTGEPHSTEEYTVLPHGMAIFLSQITPLRDIDNNIIGVLGVSIDITDRKKMEAALRKAKEAAEIANHAKTEFIANMSHDIYTPLRGIVGLSKLMETRLVNEQDKQYASWISESGKQLLQLLNSVLEVVSDDSLKEHELNKEVIDLRDSIEGLAHLVLPTVKMKKINLYLKLDSSLPEKVITDAAKLHRILLNLLGNAIKFTETGSVIVAVKQIAGDKDYVQIQFSITDTGIGIANEDQTRVFERFFRVNPSYRGAYGGYGVGLHIAQNFASLLGGEIQLSSELGRGSTFYFTLSMKVANDLDRDSIQMISTMLEEGLTVTESLDDQQIPVYTKTPYILLVEANIVALRFIEVLALKLGCRFASTTDANHAMELIKLNNFDFIFTDLELPGISGRDLIKQIRDIEKSKSSNPSILIGLTGHHMQEAAPGYEGSGLNEVIAKPVHLNTMRRVIEERG